MINNIKNYALKASTFIGAMQSANRVRTIASALKAIGLIGKARDPGEIELLDFKELENYRENRMHIVGSKISTSKLHKEIRVIHQFIKASRDMNKEQERVNLLLQLPREYLVAMRDVEGVEYLQNLLNTRSL